MKGVATLALLLVGFSGVRDPDEEAPIVWADRTVMITVQQDGSDDVQDGSDLAAIRAAMAVWGNVPCSDFTYGDGGTTASRDDAADGVNLIAFREGSWPGGANGAVAFTTRRRNTAAAPQTWDEADILLNGVDFSWSTTGDVHRFDVQSVATHELGHALGLDHSALPEATMYFGTRRGVTYARTLQEDDVAGLCWLYPLGARTCDDDGDCPLLQGIYGGAELRYACGGGSCALGASAAYGAECSGNQACAGGLCAQDPERTSGADPDFCSMSCNTPADCRGDLCSGGSCYVGRDDCLTDVDCPGNNNVCVFDLDGRFRCRSLCLEDRHCAAGAVCHGGTGANPPGFCRTPGPSPEGTSCQHGLECDSLACTGGGASPSCQGPPRIRMDGGPRPDAGASDRGVIDAVAGADARPQGTDGGGSDLDAGVLGDTGVSAPEVGGGCGCTAPAGRGTWGAGGWAGLLPFFLILLGRRSPAFCAILQRRW